MQQVLIISTLRAGLRSEAVGWTAEDPESSKQAAWERIKVNPQKYQNIYDVPIGLCGYYKGWYSYPTVLHALMDNWKLLAPPECKESSWVWYLVRESL